MIAKCDRLEKLTKTRQESYISIINKYYTLYYKLKEEPEKETELLKKAEELDKYYESVYDKKPKNSNAVIELIEDDYRLIDPTYPPKYYILEERININGKKQKLQIVNPDYMKWDLARENCEMLTIPEYAATWLDYKYEGKIYHTTYDRWRNGCRLHLR